MVQHILDTPIEYLKGVGPSRAEMLRKEVGVNTFNDLLHYYPFRYVDRSKFYRISDIDSDSAWIQLRGKITSMQTLGTGRTSRLVLQFTDGSGQTELLFFQGIKWAKEKVIIGKEYIVFGKPSYFNGKYNFPHPDFQPADEEVFSPNEPLQPYYSTSEKLKSRGFTPKNFARLLRTLLNQVYNAIPETLSPALIHSLKLISKADALLNIHFPANAVLLEKAQQRLKFDELFFIQLQIIRLKFIRTEKVKSRIFSKIGDNFNSFYKYNLPFELTNAQKRVVKEIRADMVSGKQMNRLLQGDVGSGKTLVAIMSMLIALDNDCQACLMAPTEILAAQHYKTISKMLAGLNIQVALLTGSTRKAERNILHQSLTEGKLQILIGTHALIEESVQFRNLGLVVIDEQHRFGVAQRARLWEKSIVPPHILVMTATPIPRTLAMTMYGDLDVSVIDELPPERKPIKTYHFFEKDRLKVIQFMHSQIEQGRQIYIVYPLINESDKLELQALNEGIDNVTRHFPLPKYHVSIVHGKLKAAEKESEMKRFLERKTQIMVATTVIEVGVDVPNASVMIIENSERFGLSQLHQLRGRVGRGADQSFCILMSSYKLTTEGKKRLETMVRTTDGFDIAEVDLHLRGPGDIQGTQQSGLVGLKLASLVKDEKLLKLAREFAFRTLEDDPGLEKPENAPLVKHLSKKEFDWGKIS